jgi:thioredoxin 1
MNYKFNNHYFQLFSPLTNNKESIMSNVKEVGANEFAEQVESHKGFVLVDFFADWCGPCKMIAPLLDEIAASYTQLKVVKVDADKAQMLMGQFGIRGIPTLLLFNDGKIVATKVGALSLPQLRDFIDQNI